MNKKLHLLFFLISMLCFLMAKTYSQVPQKFNYQCVVRNNSGAVVGNTFVTLRFSVHDGSAGGTIVYQEVQADTTTSLGLVSFEVGGGAVFVGPFSNVNWGSGDKYLQVELDVAGGTNYTDMGTTQLLSVPYSLYAESSGQWTKNGNDIHNANSGNVGIGTASPSAKLQVEDGSFSITNTADNKRWDIAYDENDNYFYFDEYGSARRMIIANGGNVGIGTTLPTAKMHIVAPSATSQGLTVEGNHQTAFHQTIKNTNTGVNSSAILDFEVAGQSCGGVWAVRDPSMTNGTLIIGPNSLNLYLVGNGRVGVGIPNPVQKLDVAGSIRQDVWAQNVSVPANGIYNFTWNHNMGYNPVIMLVKDQTNGANMDYVEMSYSNTSANSIQIFLTNRTNNAATGDVRWIVVN